MSYGADVYGEGVDDTELQVPQGNAHAYVYANVGLTPEQTREAHAAAYENVGFDAAPSREAVAYVYENVVQGGVGHLVGTGLLDITRIIPGSGGYGTRRYGGFRYGMGEVAGPPPPVGAAASLLVEATLSGGGSVPFTAATSLTATVAVTGRALQTFLAQATLTAVVSGLDGPVPFGPTPRSEVCIPPWPEQFMYRPLKGGAAMGRSDSAALCDDGRVLYVWCNGEIVNQCHYPTVEDFAAADNEAATPGVNIVGIIGGGAPSTTVWRNYATGHLFLVVSLLGPGSMCSIRVWRSFSGNGESSPGVPDWTLWGTVQEAAKSGFETRKPIGEPFVLPNGRWLLSAPEHPEWQGVYSSADYGRTWTYHFRLRWYMFGGAYGYGSYRNIVEHGGRAYISGSGNVDPARGAWSPISDGTTWTGFDWPGTKNSDTAHILAADEGGMFVFFDGTYYRDNGPGGLEYTPDPPVTPRSERTIITHQFYGSGDLGAAADVLYGILQRVGDCDYYMVSGEILLSAPRGWGVGQVRMG